MAFDSEDKQTKAILRKIAAYCASREHSIFEVKTKLESWEVTETDAVIDWLIQENFLNEARFAAAYAVDKFRFNQWGKIKIRMMLKNHHLDNESIQKALNKIDAQEYLEMLKKICKQKLQTVKNRPILNQKGAVLRFALSRGFESELIRQVIRALFKN